MNAPRTPPRRPTNWAGNITFRARETLRPSSLARLQILVSGNSRVRALGSAHSFNDIADSPDVLVSLAELPFEADIDSAARTVRISAGVRYGELCRHLHERGYALRNLGSLPHISVAGSCATATHGSGDDLGNLATAVAEIEMVTATGDIVRLSRDSDSDFHGAVVGLGALGVVTGLTLDLVPAFAVRQYVYEGLLLEALDDHFADIVSDAYSVSLFTDWRGPKINQVWAKRRVATPGPAGVNAEAQTDSSAFFGAPLADGPRHPVAGVSPAACTTQGGVPGPWYERLPHFRPDFTPSAGAELQSEYLLPREHAVAAIHALYRVRAGIHPALQISEIRTVAADELWLSPCYRRDVAAIHFTWIEDEREVRPAIRLVEKHLAPFTPRPHWGKIFTTAPAELRDAYERLPAFVDLMRHYDPTGKFVNPFVRRHLLEPDAA